MNTTQFSLTVGVNPGYFHANQHGAGGVPIVWQEQAAVEFAKSGIYIGAEIHCTITVYNEAWGCPPGGEVTCTVKGLRNPTFCQDDAGWREAVRRVTAAIAKELQQKTAYLTFQDVDFVYITN